MNIDPKWRFIIGLLVTFAIGVTQGTVSLTNAIPADFIKPVVAWCGIIAFFGSAITTAISGLGMSNSSRLAAAQPVPLPDKLQSLVTNNPEVQSVVTTQAVANATPSAKVTSNGH